MPVRFSKGEALGNDYIVVERPSLDRPWTEERTVALCDRHRGVGSDGVLLAECDARPVWLRIYNPDGSEAEKSGNGLRILGAHLYRTGRVALGEAFEVELATDTVVMTVEAELERAMLDISVDMGPTRFLADAVGVELPVREGTVTAHPVSLGNPHCVVLEEALERGRFESLGPQLERHAHFPRGTNVQFARPLGGSVMEAWIHERGVGETLASGSSACAVAAVARRLGLVDAADVEVRMRGGRVAVHVGEDYRLRLRGPARIVCNGECPDGVLP